MRIIVLVFTPFILLSPMNDNSKKLVAEEFVLEWSHSRDSVHFSLFAPTNGWLAIGFTEGESIVNSNLIQAKIKGGEVVIEDQYVTGFGRHPSIESLGGNSTISSISGNENKKGTTISFSIEKEKMDKYHYDLSKGKKINIWLAYSVSDDFTHHSRKRIMRTIEL